MSGKTVRYNLFRWARGRARKQGMDFTISEDDIVVPMFCPVLDLELKVGEGVATASSPTIDRIDNNKGYTPDNIWVISNLANIMKSKASPDELLRFSDWIRKKYIESH